MGCGIGQEHASATVTTDQQSALDAALQSNQHLTYACADDGQTLYSNSSVDFTCQFHPEEFAVQFLELVDYDPKRTLGYPRFKQLLCHEYTFLYPHDVDIMFRYIYYSKVKDYKAPFSEEKLDKTECSCIQFIKFGYLFYRFAQILRQPQRALFYFLDDGFNLHVDFKQLKKLLRLHYNIDLKNAITLFKCISARRGFVNYSKYNSLLQYFDRAGLTDDLVALFKCERDEQHQPTDLDKSLDPDVEMFSDISTHTLELAAQADDVLRRKCKRQLD